MMKKTLNAIKLSDLPAELQKDIQAYISSEAYTTSRDGISPTVEAIFGVGKKLPPLSKTAREFLDALVNHGRWEQRADGRIDIEGSIYTHRTTHYLDFVGDQVQFGHVTGNFNCQSKGLTSLKGSPLTVGGNFRCYGNLLTTLRDAPIEVEEDFDCGYNPLKTFQGSPLRLVGGDFVFQHGWSRDEFFNRFHLDITKPVEALIKDLLPSVTIKGKIIIDQLTRVKKV